MQGFMCLENNLCGKIAAKFGQNILALMMDTKSLNWQHLNKSFQRNKNIYTVIVVSWLHLPGVLKMNMIFDYA